MVVFYKLGRQTGWPGAFSRVAWINDHKSMTKEERHKAIMEQLLGKGSVLVSDLSDLLQVSSVTIRKDLTEMEREGKLYRSHGKAIMVNPFTNNRTVNEKEKLFPEEKYCIGLEAAKLISYNDSIIIASGTTIHAFAHCIKPVKKLTVVSASLQSSIILAQNHDIDIFQLGGMLRHSSESVVGPYGESFLEGCSFSKLFIGVDGIDFDFGITTTDLREAHLNQIMMRAAQKTIVLADSSKFGRRGFAKIANLEDIDMVITDSNIPDMARRRMEELGIDLIIAQTINNE
jgi:DeoR family transcriptional regulator of aga operon